QIEPIPPVNEEKTNGIDQIPKNVTPPPATTNGTNPIITEHPQPAPRRINSQTSTDQGPKVAATTPKQPVVNNTASESQQQQQQPPPQQNHKKATPTSSLDGDDAQVLPRPITNEEFQAMIPAHFLTSSNTASSKSPEPTQTVSVTIKRPEPPIELPPAPNGPGRVTETITKSTFTETVVTRITDNKLVVPVIIEDVTLSKAGGSLGFSIIGGTDHSSIPFGSKEPGIFISHMVPGGTADSCGKLRVGDRIIKVNGTDVTQATHQEAVMELLRPGDQITLSVRHDPLPEGFQV
ncbi:PDZ domain-containing protein, partial [Oryctes borbonicus]